VEELFEARRMPKVSNYHANRWFAKIITSERVTEQRVVRVEHSEMTSDEYEIPKAGRSMRKTQARSSMGEVIAEQGEAQINAQHNGRVRIEGRKVVVSYEQHESEDYDIPRTSRLLIHDEEKVEAGQALTEGSSIRIRSSRSKAAILRKCT
jgi:DNA-directed RNA polymerase subunit beta'